MFVCVRFKSVFLHLWAYAQSIKIESDWILDSSRNLKILKRRASSLTLSSFLAKVEKGLLMRVWAIGLPFTAMTARKKRRRRLASLYDDLLLVESRTIQHIVELPFFRTGRQNLNLSGLFLMMLWYYVLSSISASSDMSSHHMEASAALDSGLELSLS